MLADFNQIKKDNLTSRIYEQIKEAIMSGRFQPGERLPIRKLAEKMGTSTTPVREAILTLVSYGALDKKPAHPITVPVLNKEKYLENRTIRIAVEGLAAVEAAKKINKQQLNGLIECNQKMNKAGEEGRLDDLIRYNYSFHIQLCKAANMPALLEIVENLWMRIGPSLNILRTPEDTSTSKADFHQPILDALEKGDSEAAKDAIEQDLIHGGAPLLAYFERQTV